jgi:hypothetical protein
MATNNILQYLEELDADGNDYGVTPSNRRQVETFIANGAIADGAWVSFDIDEAGAGAKSLYVVEGDGNGTGTQAVFGVALGGAAAAGDKVKVQICGLVSAKVDGSSPSIAIGDALFISDTAGVAIAATDASGANINAIVGTACEASSGAGSILCLIARKF